MINPDPIPRHNRWERLEELLEVAGATSDYDVTLAMDQLLDYVLSDQGSEFRRIFAAELVDAVDRLGADTTSYVLRNWRALAQGTPLGPVVVPPTVGLAGVGGVAHDPGRFLLMCDFVGGGMCVFDWCHGLHACTCLLILFQPAH